MTRQGEDLHKLVEFLERSLLGREGVTIEAPKFFKDKITGDSREHDVVLTYKDRHRELVVAIECRDRSRKVGVPQIEEFYTKCRDTGIDKGVIVSSKGFAKTALTKATHYNIDCLLLEQAENLDWCTARYFSHYSRGVTDSRVAVFPLDDSLLKLKMFEDLRLFHILANEGVEEITAASSQNFINNIFNNLTPEQAPPEDNLVNIEISNFEDFYLLDKEDKRHKIKKIKLSISYQTKIKETPVKFYNYGKDLDKSGCSAAITEIDLGVNTKGKILMINDKENNVLRVSIQKI